MQVAPGFAQQLGISFDLMPPADRADPSRQWPIARGRQELLANLLPDLPGRRPRTTIEMGPDGSQGAISRVKKHQARREAR